MQYTSFKTIKTLTLLASTMFVLPAWTDPAESKTGRFANVAIHGIDEQVIQLTDGEWEGEPFVEGGASRPRVGLVDDFVLSGDIDHDGIAESVVLLWKSEGGSGTFDYLAAMKENDSTWFNLATAELGDRVKVKGGEISDGVLSLEVIQQGAEDPACCPGQWVKRTWVLDDQQLIEQPLEDLGRVSTAMLEGSEWVYLPGDGDVAPPPDVQASFQVNDGQIAGVSGCNRFSASIIPGETEGEISIGMGISTLMACPEPQMEFESAFLGRLAQVSSFSFRAGKLLLIGNPGDETVVMEFAASR